LWVLSSLNLFLNLVFVLVPPFDKKEAEKELTENPNREREEGKVHRWIGYWNVFCDDISEGEVGVSERKNVADVLQQSRHCFEGPRDTLKFTWLIECVISVSDWTLPLMNVAGYAENNVNSIDVLVEFKSVESKSPHRKPLMPTQVMRNPSRNLELTLSPGAKNIIA
jgi:hypothetical protein